MAGLADLPALLVQMEPVLADAPYGFGVADAVPPGLQPFALIHEAEGITVLAEVAVLAAAGIVAGEAWARISLTVHSDLAAVGLTAAITTALTEAGISANVVAGYYHDHVFVPWERRQDAMAALDRFRR